MDREFIFEVQKEGEGLWELSLVVCKLWGRIREEAKTPDALKARFTMTVGSYSFKNVNLVYYKRNNPPSHLSD